LWIFNLADKSILAGGLLNSMKIPRRAHPSRRDFLKAAAVGTAGLLASCRSINSPTTTSTLDGAESPTATAIHRPDIIRFWPDAKSTVVRVRNRAVWDGDKLVPEALRRMLDDAIAALTGLDDPRQAWATLFAPHERIAVKVNTIRDSAVWTHVPLVLAVTECLKNAGVAPEQIIVYDRGSDEMIRAGYIFNKNQPGVRYYGTDEQYIVGWQVLGKPVDFSNVLLDCDALINMPLLKPHGSSGISFAMKNHYGSFAYPWRPTGWWHETEGITRGLPMLNSLPPIKDRTRLIIGDILESVSADWQSSTPGDSILMSFDPVAHDSIGLALALKAAMEAGEIDPETIQAGADLASQWLENAAGLGLGTNDPNNMEPVELELG
jgi:hypothetical protein